MIPKRKTMYIKPDLNQKEEEILDIAVKIDKERVESEGYILKNETDGDCQEKDIELDDL